MKYLANILYRISHILRKIANRLTIKDHWKNTLREWSKDNEKENLILNFPELDENSLVFDLGGFKGQFASDIYSKYLSNIYIFETFKVYSESIRKRFIKNPKVTAFDFGLSNENKILPFSIDGVSSSIYKKGNKTVEVELKNIREFMLENHCDHIDLMKINIEGGEYDLLDFMINENIIEKVRILLIQFHDFVPNADDRMKNIQGKLMDTHETKFQYTYLWECWKLKIHSN